jgi:aminoglycoside phosphotransferase (APT) family kinase protein
VAGSFIVRMHVDEVEIGAPLVRRLIETQFPRWSGLPLRRVASAGTDNALYRLGDDLAVRLPRIARAAGQVRKDARWLPRLAPDLPLAVPEPVGVGVAGEGFAWEWGVYRWLAGEEARLDRMSDPVAAARQLAGFVGALRRVDTSWGPEPARSSRGVPLALRDEATREAIAATGAIGVADGFEAAGRRDAAGERDAASGRDAAAGVDAGGRRDATGGRDAAAGVDAAGGSGGTPSALGIGGSRCEVDVATVTAAWEESLAAAVWPGEPVWIHGDLSPGNVLVRRGRVSAVIDFACLGVGDPACDLLVAWNLFTGPSREMFRAELALDEATWLRGRGWALSVALMQLPYYVHTNPPLAANARHVIAEVLADVTKP